MENILFTWAVLGALPLLLSLLWFAMTVCERNPKRSEVVFGAASIPASIFWPVTLLIVIGWFAYKGYYIIRYDEKPRPLWLLK